MPLYKYKCVKCGHIIEMLEKCDSAGRHTCEKCGSRRLEKMMPTFSVRSGPGTSGGSCPTGTCSLS
jgi:putative FmdB family regulatory protein